MFTSIKRSVLIRIGASVLATLLFCIVVLANVSLIKRANASTENANNLLSRAYGAESAHYRWASNLSNALYAGAEFTGSLDYTSCALGQWLYGDEQSDDPEIIAQSGEQTGLEGCLSVPGKWGIVTRPNVVRIKAQDRDGNWFEAEGEGLTARAFCHEIEHLDGHMYMEHVIGEIHDAVMDEE